MNFENLNTMITYIENHLTEEIQYSQLANMLGISEYNLQRIFMFITNISLAEYIRKRRLSKALEEIKNTNNKIIDIAIKYQYDSAISFARSFKNMFEITPSNCRQNKIEYQMFPVIHFENNSNLCGEIKYQMKELEEFEIYCVSTHASNLQELYIKIQYLYKEIKQNGLWAFFNKKAMYGLTIENEKELYYYIGCKEKCPQTETVKIPCGQYFVFEVGSRNQEDIVKTENRIYNQWDQSTNMKINETFDFELYTQDNCYLYVLKDR